MVRSLIKFIANGLVVYAAAYLLPGVSISSFKVALIVALVLALLNILVKPILLVLSLPVTVLTLGLFTFVIDALVVIIASEIVPGFGVNNFLTAILFSVITAILSYILYKLVD